MNKSNRRKSKAQKQSNQLQKDGASLSRYQSQYARYISLGDDFLSVDDAVEAERNYQHAEHCLRMIAAINQQGINTETAALIMPVGYPDIQSISQEDEPIAGQMTGPDDWADRFSDIVEAETVSQRQGQPLAKLSSKQKGRKKRDADGNAQRNNSNGEIEEPLEEP
jgi:hypothetical protein